MSFEALQRRAVSGGRTAARLAQEMPAHFIAFDLLQLDGQKLLQVPYGERRAQLEELFTGRGLGAPWTLCPGGVRPGDGRAVADVLDAGARRRRSGDPGEWSAVSAGSPRALQGAPPRHHRSDRGRDHRHRTAAADARPGPPRPDRDAPAGRAQYAAAAGRGARPGRAADARRARPSVGGRTVHDLLGVPYAARRRARRTGAGRRDHGGHGAGARIMAAPGALRPAPAGRRGHGRPPFGAGAEPASG